MTTVTLAPSLLQPVPYVNGSIISWASNTTLSITAGKCLDSTNTFDIVTSAATLDGSKVDLNALDTGALAASTCYYIYAIGSSLNNAAPAHLISASRTAPVLPVNYDLYKMVGVAFTDGSTHFVKIYQSGNGNTRVYTYDTLPVVLNAGTQTSYTAVALGAVLPVQDNLLINLQASYTPAVAANVFSVRPSGSTATVVVTGTGVVAAKAQNLSINAVAKLLSNVPNIEYLVTASDALTLSLVSFTLFV